MTKALLRTEIVRDTQRFAALSKDWDALADHLGTPLACHAWYIAALAALQQHKFELSVVLIWNDQLLVAAGPLMLDKMRSPARLIPIDSFAGEPFLLLYRDSEALAALAHACAGLNRPILLRRLQSSESDLELLSATLRSKALVYCKPRHVSAVAPLPIDFETFEAAMSSSRRTSIRGKRRAAVRELGEVQIEFVMPDPGSVDLHMARFKSVEGSGWKQRSGTALSTDPRMDSFISQLANVFARKEQLIIAYLTIGGRDAACRLILCQQSSWFELKTGFDEQFGRFAPGIVLMHETLREACRTSITKFEYLGVHEGWQDNWPRELTEDFRVATYPFRPAGALALAADGLQALSSLSRR
ncbi:MAG: GNAT family N-acetyltransferase [Sphingomonadales bacterium]|jgi:CelD/BcsL family acetyltransferase involved in cellulose biosynthesis|nr:GNAT family N-acetyltransferase [Sphingomonadales bacterium]MBK9268057.1 GNAT family N-acetyltransferase [Sphingomonadales bacterium]